MAGAPQVRQRACSCLAIFSPQSGHHTSSSGLAMKTDCHTPRCFLGLQCVQSATVSLVGLKAQAASCCHLLKWSVFDSHSLWKKLFRPSTVKIAVTGSSLWITLPHPAQDSKSLSRSSVCKREYQWIVTRFRFCIRLKVEISLWLRCQRVQGISRRPAVLRRRLCKRGM